MSGGEAHTVVTDMGAGGKLSVQSDALVAIALVASPSMGGEFLIRRNEGGESGGRGRDAGNHAQRTSGFIRGVVQVENFSTSASAGESRLTGKCVLIRLLIRART